MNKIEENRYVNKYHDSGDLQSKIFTLNTNPSHLRHLRLLPLKFCQDVKISKFHSMFILYKSRLKRKKQNLSGEKTSRALHQGQKQKLQLCMNVIFLLFFFALSRKQAT